MKIHRTLSLISVIIPFLLVGCVETLSLVSLPATIVQLSATTYQSIEQADITVALSSEVTRSELRELKQMAVMIGKESISPPYGRIGNLEAVVGDNLCIQLNGMGFEAFGWSDIEQSFQKNLSQEDFRTNTLIEAGKALGAQVVISGQITPCHKNSLGLFGVGAMHTVVQNLALRLIRVSDGNPLMLITINYDVGQKPQVVAEGIAMILKAKCQDPAADLKEVFKKKEKNVG